MTFTRRTALKTFTHGLMLGGAGLALGEQKALSAASDIPHLPKGGTILFQGDSITDGGRGRSLDPNHIFGQDYAYLIAAQCGGHYPAQHWTFLNRGVSGNKVTDLATRWQTDTLALKPDLLSILIGVNDASSVVYAPPGGGSGVTVEQYEQVYDQLLQQTLAAFPQVKFVLCEPFVMPVGKVKDNWDAYQNDIPKRQDVVTRLAAKYKAPVVRFQKVFTDADKLAPAEYWVWDGVHPTAAGHQLMADEWLRTVNVAYRFA